MAYRSLVGGFFSDDPLDKSVPVSIRTNNPGALNSAPWLKTFPGYLNERVTTPGNSTAIFETPEHGVAAWWVLMTKYRANGATTVKGIIQRYGGGQNYSAYVTQVVKWTGLSPDQQIDLYQDDELLLLFAKAMFRYEAGRSTPLSDAQVLYGFELGRNGGNASTLPPTMPPQAPREPVGEFPEEGSYPHKGSVPQVTGAPRKRYGLVYWILWGLWQLVKWAAGYNSAARTPPAAPTEPVEELPEPGEPELPPPSVKPPESRPAAPPWYEWALGELGWHERGVNRGLAPYIQLAKCGQEGDPWCAIFVNAGIERAGFRGSRSAMARSFETNANFEKLSGPALGCIVTAWRTSRSSGQGHVGYYAGHNAKGEVILLGGNQSDEVSFAPIALSRITGYWWPSTSPMPKVGKVPFTGKHKAEGSET
jgi:uncharacterized protein (TIGR02594 family)